MNRTLSSALLFALMVGAVGSAPASPRAGGFSEIVANDNRVAAGTLSHGTLNLSLDARAGYWSPDGPGKAAIPVEAFGETGKPLQIPGPLVRVPAGTIVVASVRNSITGTTLTIKGMAGRPASADNAVAIPSGQVRTFRFALDAPGTYYYWGSTTGLSIATRLGADSQLIGAIVVDRPGTKWDPNTDRTFVFSEWDDVLDSKKDVDFNFVVLAINGLRYPATERLSYVRGTHVTWHIIDGSAESHPLHLHGFYFDVASRGDGLRDVEYPAGSREKGVTELFRPGRTATLAFYANRAGNWMFHCHIAYHIVRYLPLTANAATHNPDADAMLHMMAMGGMILRYTIVPKPTDAAVADLAPVARRITLLAEPVPNAPPKTPAFKYEIQDGDSTLHGTGTLGPALILTQNQMTAITVVNHLDEATAVHWHGIEQHNAYYDGVPDYSGYGNKLEPAIEPGKSFVASFAPPRAGTFIYHTHMNDVWQMRNGLTGPLIVIPAGTRFDPATDHVVQVTSTPDLDDDTWFDVNGTRNPAAITMTAGVPNRFRFINMSIFIYGLVVSLVSPSGTASWIPIARDGADLPAAARTARPATQAVTIGQTRDFVFTAPAPGEYRLLFWGHSGGHLRATLPIHVVANAVANR